MTDKIAIITGANRGLGRSTALRLAEDGVDLIINLSTGLTRFTGQAHRRRRRAQWRFSPATAAELGPRGITVNTVAPGPVATDFGGGVVRDNAQVRSRLEGQSALGRVGRPEDIGGVIAALLSEDTGWITGQRVEVSGGTLL
jgi:NAD(P)-dependent dehydrogenase (short-subunit alcohol dehydrogenase family)